MNEYNAYFSYAQFYCNIQRFFTCALINKVQFISSILKHLFFLLSVGLAPDIIPSIKDKVKEVEKTDLSRGKSATPNTNSTPTVSTPTGNSIAGTPPVSSPTSTSSTNTASNIGSSKGTKRSRTRL